MECAHLRNHTFLKPSPYVEIIVDDIPPRRTEIIKNSPHPKWNESFTVLVTPHSKIHFCVLDHNNFRKDTTLGEKKLDLVRLLSCFNGVLQNVEVTLDLTNENKQSETPIRMGELVCVLNGLELRNYMVNGASGSNSQNNSDVLPNRTMQEGVRARIRPPIGESSTGLSSRSSLEVYSGLTNSPSANNMLSPVPNGKRFYTLYTNSFVY